MLFLLPPSESKLGGGSVGSALDLGSLSFPSLTSVRETTLDDLVALSEDREASVAALKLGPRSADEVDRNVAVRSSPTMPTLQRYTGVLFDPVGAADLDAEAWTWAERHVVVHSALFGLLGATDPVPAYRLSHDSRLPGGSLKARWAPRVTEALVARDETVVDLRSEGYVGLGPLGPVDGAWVRVVSDEGGRRRALNHFNKKAKGLFLSALLQDRPELDGLDDLVEWAHRRGIGLELGDGLTLVAGTLLERV